MSLNRMQYRYLKRFAKRSFTHSDLPKESQSICDYLIKLGYLEITYPLHYETNSNGFPVPDTENFVQITELGKAYLHAYKVENYRWLIPVIISIFSALVSVIALYKSSQPMYIQLTTNNATIASVNDVIDKR